MQDAIQITRPTSTATMEQWDDAKGKYVDAPAALIYLGAGLVSSKGWNPRNEVAAGQTDTVSTYEVSIPLGNIEVLPDDVVEVLQSLRSPYLIGKTFTVKAQIMTSWAISQKFLVEVWDGKRPR